MNFKISTWRSVGKLVMLLVRFSQAERFRENLLCYSDRIDGESISNLPLLETYQALLSLLLSVDAASVFSQRPRLPTATYRFVNMQTLRLNTSKDQ